MRESLWLCVVYLTLKSKSLLACSLFDSNTQARACSNHKSVVLYTLAIHPIHPHCFQGLVWSLAVSAIQWSLEGWSSCLMSPSVIAARCARWCCPWTRPRPCPLACRSSVRCCRLLLSRQRWVQSWLLFIWVACPASWEWPSGWCWFSVLLFLFFHWAQFWEPVRLPDLLRSTFYRPSTGQTHVRSWWVCAVFGPQNVLLSRFGNAQ